jgi:hypothetical protein
LRWAIVGFSGAVGGDFDVDFGVEARIEADPLLLSSETSPAL